MGHVAGYVFRLASTLIMTRLLAPEVFGVIALAAVVQAVTSLLSDVGLRQAIIQSPRGDAPAMLNTAWTIQIGRGFLIWGVCAAVAGALHLGGIHGVFAEGSAYAHPDLAMVIVMGGLSAAIMGFQSTKAITTTRHLQFGRPITIELIAQAIGLTVMVALGWGTRSIWAIVVGGIVTSLIAVVLSHTWLEGMSNRVRWERVAARELFSYGGWVLLSSVLFAAASNGDRLLLGAWVDASTLGLYSIALNLAMIVEGFAGRLFGSVAMAALSEIARDDPARLRVAYKRLRVPVDAAMIGAAGFLFAFAPTLVDILYDDRYQGAGRTLQILSFSLLVARYGLNESAYMALGHPALLTWTHLLKVVCVYTLVPLGYELFGYDGALVAIALHGLPRVLLLMQFNRKFNLNDFRFEFWILFLWPVGYAAGVASTWVISRFA